MIRCDIHAPHSAEERMRTRIRRDLSTFGRDVSFELRDREIVLTGVVGSYYQKQMAQESLRRIEGVGRIDNQLAVVAR